MRFELPQPARTRGHVDFVAFPASCAEALRDCLMESPEALGGFIARHAVSRHDQHNLIFNYPRRQYGALDRGETPEPVDARYLTLSHDAYTDPAVETVAGEVLRVAATTRAADPFNPTQSIVRFLLDAGQLVGTWETAILIGGNATATPGTGKIIAAVNNVLDDNGGALSRDGTTVHLVSWRLMHLDGSEEAP